MSGQTPASEDQLRKQPEKKLFARIQGKRSGVQYVYITAVSKEYGWKRGDLLRFLRGFDDKGEPGIFLKKASEQTNPKPRKRRTMRHDPLSQKRCLRCHRWNPLDAQYCIRCGKTDFDRVETAKDRPDLQQEAQEARGATA